MFGNLFDMGWWANKINSKLGVYEWAKKSKFRKWQEGLTGWKFLDLADSRRINFYYRYGVPTQ